MRVPGQLGFLEWDDRHCRACSSVPSHWGLPSLCEGQARAGFPPGGSRRSRAASHSSCGRARGRGVVAAKGGGKVGAGGPVDKQEHDGYSRGGQTPCQPTECGLWSQTRSKFPGAWVTHSPPGPMCFARGLGCLLAGMSTCCGWGRIAPDGHPAA